MFNLVKYFVRKIQKKFCEHDYVIIAILGFIDSLISVIPLEFLISGYTITHTKIKILKIILVAALFSVLGSVIIYILGLYGFDFVYSILDSFDVVINNNNLQKIGNSVVFYIIVFLFLFLPFTPGLISVFTAGLLQSNLFFVILIVFCAKFLKYLAFVLFTQILSHSIFKKIDNIYIKILVALLFLAGLYYGFSQLNILENF